MMSRFILLSAIIIIVSCSKKEEMPNGIIKPEKMADILSDIYWAEHKSTNIGIRYDSSKVIFKHYERAIFEEHNTTDSVYKQSFKYYLDHPEEMEKIYDIVIDSLSLKERLFEVNSKDKLSGDDSKEK